MISQNFKNSITKSNRLLLLLLLQIDVSELILCRKSNFPGEIFWPYQIAFMGFLTLLFVLGNSYFESFDAKNP